VVLQIALLTDTYSTFQSTPSLPGCMIRSGGRIAGEPSSPPRQGADHDWNHQIGATYRFWVMAVPEDYIDEKQARCQTTGARCILIGTRKMAPSKAS
jgi:hypothetical protein